jgi:hypothetical protein
MIRQIILGAVFLLSGCGADASGGAAAAENGSNAVEREHSELVAVEFSGGERSLNRLAEEVVRLGWRVDSHSSHALRILPPPNYEPSQFGRLLERISELGLRDIGLRLIGPNGPVGPEG